MSKEITKTSGQLSPSQRFADRVLQEFTASAGQVNVTEKQRRLIQGYFVGIDKMLKTSEENRIARNAWADAKNDLPFSWQNIEMNALATDVVHYSRMGYDIMQPNFIHPIPFKDEKSKKYVITFIEGYSAKVFKAEKYALDKPLNVIAELVHKNDTFKVFKKDKNNTCETYEFEINPFDRGEIIGGFGYIEYPDTSKNKLIIMSRDEMEKRKPKYASAEFWGGEKNIKGKTVKIEGWTKEMLYKTLLREIFHTRNIPIDPAKIDDDYLYSKQAEVRAAEMETRQDEIEYANTIEIDTEPNEPPMIAAEYDNQEPMAAVEVEFDELP